MMYSFKNPLPEAGPVIFSLIALTLICGSSAVLAASKAVPPGGEIDAAREAAHIRQVSVLDDSEDDVVAVQDICIVCHSSFQYLTTPCSSDRWEQVFAEMTGYGANPSDEQVDQIVRNYQRNLTVVGSNTSPSEVLAATLQLDKNATNAVVARRAQKMFSGIDDLATVPGVNNSVLQNLKTNLQF